MKEPTVHLYWAFKKPHLLVGLTTGVTLCGLHGVAKRDLTSIPKYSTCTKCKIVYNKREANDANARTP
jgi:hypothetical protein